MPINNLLPTVKLRSSLGNTAEQYGYAAEQYRNSAEHYGICLKNAEHFE
jgi:hypothetical protein